MIHSFILIRIFGQLMCKIALIHDLITLRTTVSLLHYCKGSSISKVPASGPLKYSGYFPLSVDKVIFFHLSFAVQQGMRINQGCLLLDCQYVLYVVCMYMRFLLLCALEKDPICSLLLLGGSGKFTCTVALLCIRNPIPSSSALKQKEVFPLCLSFGLQCALKRSCPSLPLE